MYISIDCNSDWTKFSIIRTVVGKKSSKKKPTLTLDIWMGEWENMKF